MGLKGRANVARVNKETYGEKTGRRFGLGLDANPAIIYFRLGKMYRYTLEKFDPESMANFVEGFYKNLPAENIPPPKSPFDDLVQLCVDYLKEYPLLVGSGLACPVLLLHLSTYNCVDHFLLDTPASGFLVADEG